jgi:hypothetical protein
MQLDNLTERIVDVNSGEEIIRPYTAEEISLVEIATAKITSYLAAKEAEESAKEIARQAVLSKIGLTAEEAAALLA